MATPTEQAPQIDEQKLEQFMGKIIGDMSGAYVTAMGHLGDRLGLFKDLAANGPATSQEFADRAGINERYGREWLAAMASAGYIEYNPSTSEFTLPPEHAMALAQEGSPVFVGGMFHIAPYQFEHFREIADAFRNGGGVAQAKYDQEFWAGLQRFTNGWFQNHLVQDWLPLVPDVQAKLRSGADVADIGPGNGTALIKMAQEFPASRFVGYDIFEPSVERANGFSEEAGVSDRVTFIHHDASNGLPEKFDLITTFDVIHDMVNPRGALKAIQQGLKPDGTYLTLEIRAADRLEDNAGPLGALFYGVSVFYCMTSSLAEGGEGLGTMGMSPAVVEKLCKEAGFRTVNLLPFENPFNALFEVKN